MDLFSEAIYTRRRAQLKTLVGNGQILLMGNDESSSNFEHNHYPFRQDSSFLYFFGIDRPGLVGLIDIDANKETIFGEEATIDDVVWTGPQALLADLAARVGVLDTAPLHRLSATLGATVHFLPPYRPENILKLGAWLTKTPEAITAGWSKPLVESVVALRSVKDDGEIEELEKASKVTASIHLTAMKAAVRGTREFEVLAEMQHAAAMANSSFSFPPIVTTNGQTLHNYYYGHELREGLFLCDAGGESAKHYAGDMTRTYPVATTFTTKEREIYDIVASALQASVQAAKADILFKEVHLQAALVIAEGLKDLGLMKGESVEAVSAGAHALFFPHGLGHMLGLDVHDMEDLGEDLVGYDDEVSRSSQFGLKSLRLGRRLQEGFAFTIEPGIYFIPELIEKWQSEKRFADYLNYPKILGYLGFGGIRLENDYYIKHGKAELLGPAVPLTNTEVEDFRKSLD
ncbi:MAG: aminopeptidase P family protein [Bacteroidota bacterium]